MKALNIVVLFLSFSLPVFAADNPYHVKNIPEALLKKANAVKRMEEVRFEIVNLKETILTKHYAITVLNEAGDAYAELEERYDKLRMIKSVQGVLYDAAGNVLKKVKGKDITDIKGYDGMSLLDDSRLKRHNFNHRTYPYTVAYEIEITHNHTFYLDSWYPQAATQFSVQQSRYTVVAPQGYKVRVKALNLPVAPTTSTDKGKTVMQWQVAELLAFTRPFASPVWTEIMPAVLLAPSDFEIADYKGNMSSWSDLGKFQAVLNKGRDVLPEPFIQKAKALTASVPTDAEKVKVLYEFMQQNTRYISIQLGIGGWQPFEAAYIAEKGYGDCKGLSNYMYSLLKSVGIKSHYAIIRAGTSKEDRVVMEDFPSKQSNHVVLCVPLQKDTLWLECTSQTDPAGYMGNFTGNRKALLVDEEGGKLVATPRYGLNENQQLRKVKGVIDEKGNLKAQVQTLYTGIQQDGLQGMVQQVSKDKLKELLNQNLDFSTYEINDFKYSLSKGKLPSVDEQIELQVSHFSTVSGKRLFITPNLLNHSEVRLAEEEKDRKLDYVFDTEYRDVDSVELELPAGYELEALPKEVNLKTAFGAYTTTVKMQGNKLLFIRTIEQYAGRFAPSTYQQMADYYSTIFKADRARVVLVKKEG